MLSFNTVIISYAPAPILSTALCTKKSALSRPFPDGRARHSIYWGNYGTFPFPITGQETKLLLHTPAFLAIICLKNKNAAAYGCANTRKPAQVLTPPTQRPLAAPHRILYDNPVFLVKSGFVVIYLCLCRMRRSLLTLCRLCPAQRFCFSPTPRGRKPPRRLR